MLNIFINYFFIFLLIINIFPAKNNTNVRDININAIVVVKPAFGKIEGTSFFGVVGGVGVTGVGGSTSFSFGVTLDVLSIVEPS